MCSSRPGDPGDSENGQGAGQDSAQGAFQFFFVTAVKWPWLLVKTGDFYSDFAGDQ